MNVRRRSFQNVLGGSALLFLILFLAVRYLRPLGPAPLSVLPPPLISKERIAAALEEPLNQNRFPEKLEFSTANAVQKTVVKYTIDTELQSRIELLLHSYKPDFAAFVALDASNGKVLALASFTREPSLLGNLALKATFPAASVFKIVTATAALDQRKVTPDTVIPFNGSNHTLYRRNINQNTPTRWTRRMTLREAFAKSVNTVFGKLGAFVLAPHQLIDYARRFLFNTSISTDLPVQAGTFHFENPDNWAAAEAASGFNRIALMSPLQGALMASSVVNDGVVMAPYAVETLFNEEGGVVYQAEPKVLSTIMTADSAAKLRELMRETVLKGTSRKIFRGFWKHPRFQDLEVGGKTGSLRGLSPEGKCDWFVGYAMDGEHKIAFSALTVNEESWRVKSSFLARAFIESYFKTRTR